MFVFKRNQIIITALVFMVAIAAYLNFTDNKNEVQPTFEDDAKQVTQKDDLTYTNLFEPYEFGDIATLAPDIDSLEQDEMADEIDMALAETDGEGMAVSESDGEDMALKEADGVENDLVAEAQVRLKEEKVVLTLKDRMIAENQRAQSALNLTTDYETAVVSKSYDVNYFIEAKMDREQKRSEQIEILSECINNNTLDKDSKSNAAANLITLQERIEKESEIESLLKAKGFKEVYVRISDGDIDVIINKEKIEEEDIAQIEDIVRRKTGYKTSQVKISPLKN